MTAILVTAFAVAVAVVPAAVAAEGDPEPPKHQFAPPPSPELRRASRDPVPILDVPYVMQSEELCGGAAVAMVMRFWGATGIYAESFSSLVDKRAGGIKGEDLIRSLHDRGWQAVSSAGDRQLIERSLAQRRPAIALIEVRPGRFHYVVIVSWTDGRVVVHDPARKPFEVRDEADFTRAWDRSGRWTLLAEPVKPAPGVAVTGNGEVPEAAPTPGVCGPLVDDAIDLANRSEIPGARRFLEDATAGCPGEAAGWRELAGLDALVMDWASAADNARRALAADPGDQHAARILATSLFLQDDTLGALRAWNLAGEPTLDLVEVRGFERSRVSVLMHAMRLRPQTRLTASSLTRAARRLDALPALMASRVTYTPKDNGLAHVMGAVVERPVLPTSPLALAAEALRIGTDRELRINAANLTGGGEFWQVSWRWWENRPRAAFGLAAPAPFGGIWELSFADERETYGFATAPFQERRRTLSFSLADWMTGTARWEAGLTREEWPDGQATGVSAGVRYQTIEDRFSAAAGTTLWNHDGSEWFASSSLEWRSQVRHEGHVLLARAGGSLASQGTPLLSWSGAGVGHARAELLRAHPLLHDGVIRNAVFGRGLASGGVEWQRWGAPFKRVLRFAPAFFVDAARAYDVPEYGDPRTHVDAGAGVRLAIPGAGVLRTDLAVGLRDGKWAISVGWLR